MARFVDIDLSQLAPPKLIEQIDVEAILTELKAWVLGRWNTIREARPDLPPIDTLVLETEPITIILEALAYRETLLRARVNDAARAVLLAYATGSDLDQIGVLFGVQRMPLVSNPRPYGEHSEDWEADERLRRRIQLAPEAFSVAGPIGAYVFHALTASATIADANAFSPADGRVTVSLAGYDGEDVSDAVVQAVLDRLDRDDVVPLTDDRTVVKAAQVYFDVTADLIIPRGPDPEIIRATAIASLRSYAATRYKIASDVFPVGISAALKVGGVDNVILSSPSGIVEAGDAAIPVLRDVTVTTTVI